MKIKKAVIPAAGLGTRILPVTKAMPKEMLPIIDKPAIQYIVEEAASSGITEIMIITSRGKSILEDHFDRAPELEQKLLESGEAKKELYDSIMSMNSLANIYFVRQQEPKGLGHAILLAKEFIGNDPFAVLYGDDVVTGEVPAISELCDAFEKYGKCVVGVKEVPDEIVRKCSSVKADKITDNIFSVSDMNEKPLPEEKFSNYAIMGRCVLTPEIFGLLEKTERGAGGEIQLTDAMKVIAQTEGMTAVEFSGIRHDMGDKFEILKACIEEGLHREEFGDDLKKYIKQLAEKI